MWSPIVDGELADRVWTAVRDIAGQLATERTSLDNVALFWAYAAGALDDQVSAEAYERAIEALAAELSREHGWIHLHGGLAGIGWTLAHVGDGGGDLLSGVDAKILEILDEDPWTGHFELVHGLVGLGVYFLERRHAVGVARVVERLSALAERDAAGTRWYTPPHLLVPQQRARKPDGTRDLGVPHGTPGAIAVLARADATAICHDAIRWLRTTERDFGPRGRYPDAAENSTGTRTAWCYGDLGIAATVWSACARTGLPVDHWRELAVACATRPFEHTIVEDPGLCHGALGIAHLCNRMFQASADPRFAVAARSWIERGLAMPRPATSDLLLGTSGIGLALLATVATEEPTWDRLLACDIPPLP